MKDTTHKEEKWEVEFDKHFSFRINSDGQQIGEWNVDAVKAFFYNEFFKSRQQLIDEVVEKLNKKRDSFIMTTQSLYITDMVHVDDFNEFVDDLITLLNNMKHD